MRAVRVGDNASMLGAFVKGRAKSIGLNNCCRKSCSLMVAADLRVLGLYCPSKRNPADAPSSVYGLRADAAVSLWLTLPPLLLVVTLCRHLTKTNYALHLFVCFLAAGGTVT